MKALGLAAAALLLAAACAPSWRAAPHPKRFQREPDPELHAMLRVDRSYSDWWEKGLHAAVLPLAKAVSPARWVDAISEPRPALDVNAFGEVPDSAWFRNRIGKRDMAPDTVARPWREPPADGPLTVISGKLEGVTPGVIVRDAAGTVWYVKFDPPAYPTMSTAAEAIGSRIYWAAGYHVPPSYVLDLDLSRVHLDPSATTRDDYNREVPLTLESLRGLLLNLNPSPEGRLRAVFVKSVPGQIIGPFAFRGVRMGDPNDRLPHERRRSLRGLWVFSAWLNNTDVRRQNTLDTFLVVDEQRQLGFVRHYLIDFGTSLGAAGDRDKYIGEGYEHLVDWSALGTRLIGFGFVYPYWIAVRRSPFHAVGTFEAEVFDPARWAPAFRNPAFDEATRRDTFWAATILSRFDRPTVAAVVAQARYRDPDAAAYVVDVLMARREKLLRHAFAGFLPLVGPDLAGQTVTMTDLAVKTGLTERAAYRWSVTWNRTRARDVALASGVSEAPTADLRPVIADLLARERAAFTADPFLSLTFWGDEGGRGPSVTVHLRAAFDQLLAIGLARDIVDP